VNVEVTIRGLQEAQRAMEKAFQAVQPRGSLGQAVHAGTAMAHRFAVYNTPWDTGGLRASHRMMMIGPATGRVDIDPAAVNPRQGNRRPREYGYYLHGQGLRPGLRGGVRAFYLHTVQTRGSRIVSHMMSIVRRGLPR